MKLLILVLVSLLHFCILHIRQLFDTHALTYPPHTHTTAPITSTEIGTALPLILWPVSVACKSTIGQESLIPLGLIPQICLQNLISGAV